MVSRYIRKSEHGYVALLSVLIAGAASLTIALALLLGGTDAQRSTLVNQQSAQARSLATSCAEEALQMMHDTTSYTGTNAMNLGQGTCSYTVTNTGGNARTVDASGTVDGVVRRVRIYATIAASSISVTSWQEVAN